MKKSTLKNKLWKIVSEYIRRRDADENGYVDCCTCGKTYHWTKIQAGHFIAAAQGNATRWDERNIHSQCMRCNLNLGGNGAEYYPFMVNKYGEDFVNELRSRPMVKLSDSDYLKLIEEYSEKLARLNNV